MLIDYPEGVEEPLSDEITIRSFLIDEYGTNIPVGEFLLYDR